MTAHKNILSSFSIAANNMTNTSENTNVSQRMWRSFDVIFFVDNIYIMAARVALDSCSHATRLMLLVNVERKTARLHVFFCEKKTEVLCRDAFGAMHRLDNCFWRWFPGNLRLNAIHAHRRSSLSQLTSVIFGASYSDDPFAG
jgi:hypothetical protein